MAYLSRLVVFALAVGPAAGCGGAGGPTATAADPDAKAVAALVDDFNEFKSDSKKARGFFVTPPPAGLKYERYNFAMTGTARVTGTTATAGVQVRPDVGSEDEVEKEWTFEKVGDKWKIKTAPLPPGK